MMQSPPSPKRHASHEGSKSSRRSLRFRRLQANGDHQDLHVPIRELLSGEGGGGGSAADEGRSWKSKLHLKRKLAEASAAPRSPTCLFCLRRFSTRPDLLHHLQMDHPSTDEEQQGEENGDDEKGSSNDGLDLNQAMTMKEEVHVSAADGPRKKFRFDLNQLPPEDAEDDN